MLVVCYLTVGEGKGEKMEHNAVYEKTLMACIIVAITQLVDSLGHFLPLSLLLFLATPSLPPECIV